MQDKTRILFVCHGNICRSPLAEGVFRRLVQDAGVGDRFEADSAGTSGYHEGEGPDPRTSAEAATRGIILEHSARRLRPADFERFDYILAMDNENLAGIRRVSGAADAKPVIRLLRSFDPAAGPDPEVPDPYYGGERGFSDVHDMIERACRSLLEELRNPV